MSVDCQAYRGFSHRVDDDDRHSLRGMGQLIEAGDVMRRIKLFSLIRERVTRQGPSLSSARRQASFPMPAEVELLEPRCLLSAGDLDPSFGVGGEVNTSFNFATIFTSDGFSAATQPDGRILVAGTLSPINLSQPFTVELVRYNSNGSLDTTFGTSNGGHTNLVLPSADQITLQADGKIIVSSAAKLARLNENGTLDAMFGSGGIAAAPFTGTSYGTTVRSDGKILLLLGTSQTTQGTTLVRFNADGSLDTTFAGTGSTAAYFGRTVTVHDVAWQSDGSAILVGSASDEFWVARLTADGLLDTSFGTAGQVG